MPGALGICGGEPAFEPGIRGEELKKAKQDCPPFEDIFQGQNSLSLIEGNN